MNWKLTARDSRERIEAALSLHGRIEEWDTEIVVGAREVTEMPQDWILEAWLPRRPTRMDTMRLEKLFTGRAPPIEMERLAETDWITASQQHTAPVIAGPFRVRTPEFPPEDKEGVFEFEVPAAQAFGTGQHETTAGCLQMLATMRDRGVLARNVADIGTGTGLLAFAARALWPAARYTASDIDPVCGPAVIDNAGRNHVPLGDRRGELRFVLADGMQDAALRDRAPFDLLIANILAAPLAEMAGDFAKAVTPRGSILLAGLLREQERMVRRAYLRAGFRLHERMDRGDWSILWLRRRFTV